MKSGRLIWLRGVVVLLIIVAGGLYGWRTYLRIRREQQNQLNFALYDAVNKNDTHVVLTLLEQGADPNAADTRSSHQKTYTYADQDRTKPPGEVSKPALAPNEPALIVAAVKGNATIVHALLAKGAGVNTRNHDGKTLLMWAAEQGNVAEVQALLERGADINAKDKFKGTALLHAVENQKTPVVRLLLEHNADPNAFNFVLETPLVAAAHWPNTELTQTLLEKGADVNRANELGWTPLFYAAYYGYGEIAKLLLAHGADVNKRANDGTTALYWAKMRANTSLIAALKKSGAQG